MKTDSQSQRGSATWRVITSLAAASLVLSIVVSAGPGKLAAVADPIGGMTSTGVSAAAVDAPGLTSFKSLTLNTVGGAIQAVVYDGNSLLINDTATTTLTGFTAPASGPITARTTYVVVDGQCGAAVVMEPCVDGRPTGGSGDSLTFQASGGPLTSKGPDAWRGHDDCLWATPGGDTCLWDTRTEDVSVGFPPSASSATVSVTSAAASDGTDCINHEAQVLAVGPTTAFLFGGYQTDGVGLRNRDKATVTIAGIPPGSVVVEADLYWNILNASNPGPAMQLNSTPVSGKMFKQGGDPCWDSGSWAFRADVTSIVAPIGNGVFTLSGYPTGGDGAGLQIGRNPWDFGSRTPMAEGATLIVFYGQVSTPGKVTGGGYIDALTGQLVGDATLLINSGPSMGNKANFGFVMSFNAGDPSPTGNLLYDDKVFPERVKATSIDLLVISDGMCGMNTHFEARITAEENGTAGQTFRVFGDDCAEPGSSPGSGPDMFGIEKLPLGYTAAGPLVGGNIQVHKS